MTDIIELRSEMRTIRKIYMKRRMEMNDDWKLMDSYFALHRILEQKLKDEWPWTKEN